MKRGARKNIPILTHLGPEHARRDRLEDEEFEDEMKVDEDERELEEE